MCVFCCAQIAVVLIYYYFSSKQILLWLFYCITQNDLFKIVPSPFNITTQFFSQLPLIPNVTFIIITIRFFLIPSPFCSFRAIHTETSSQLEQLILESHVTIPSFRSNYQTLSISGILRPFQKCRCVRKFVQVYALEFSFAKYTRSIVCKKKTWKHRPPSNSCEFADISISLSI